MLEIQWFAAKTYAYIVNPNTYITHSVIIVNAFVYRVRSSVIPKKGCFKSGSNYDKML